MNLSLATGSRMCEQIASSAASYSRTPGFDALAGGKSWGFALTRMQTYPIKSSIGRATFNNKSSLSRGTSRLA